MNLKEFIIVTHKADKYLKRPRIICKNGFSMSVQGSAYHYCFPKSLQKYYDSMEIGFPTKRINKLLQYRDGSGNATESVYAYVPCELIETIIKKNGGIDIEKTF